MPTGAATTRIPTDRRRDTARATLQINCALQSDLPIFWIPHPFFRHHTCPVYACPSLQSKYGSVKPAGVSERLQLLSIHTLLRRFGFTKDLSMIQHRADLDRRAFVLTAAASALAFALPSRIAAAKSSEDRYEFCAFIKFLLGMK